MSPVQDNTTHSDGQLHKGSRLEAGLNEGRLQASNGNLLSDTDVPQGTLIKTLLCSTEPEDMAIEKITTYMDELPATTQHFDLESIWSLPLEDVKEWSGHLDTWRRLRGDKVRYLDLVDSRPLIRGGSSAPPISNLKLRLRAVVAYKDLLLQAKVEEVSADITLELARKLLDYIVLCLARARRDVMCERLPEFQKWFDWAVKTLKKGAPLVPTHRAPNLAIENDTTNSISASSNLDVAVDRNTQYCADDIDRLIVKPKDIGASMQKWKDIAGNRMVKDAFYASVVVSNKIGNLPQRTANILLFGPPGTGKTMMVNCLANMGGWTLFRVGSDSLEGKYQGESEKKLRQIFDRAKQSSPSIILFDHADTLMAARTHNQSEGSRDIKASLLSLLSEMTHSNAKVMTVATVNRPWAIDTAFLQRFGIRLYVPLPSSDAILKIIRAQLQKYDHDPFLDTPPGIVQLDLLAGSCMKDTARASRRLSGSDIVGAIDSIGRRKMTEVLRATSFEEHTLLDGTQVLRPCSGTMGNLRRKYTDLDPIDLPRTRMTDVVLGDIQMVLSEARGVASAQDIRDMVEWNSQLGSR